MTQSNENLIKIPVAAASAYADSMNALNLMRSMCEVKHLTGDVLRLAYMRREE